MISVKDLDFDYADKRALHNVTFDIGEGAITALVGPNGSGKTTLLRCLAALAKPIGGQIFINGYNTLEQPREVHLQVGYLQDLFGLYDQLTVMQSLQFTAHSRLAAHADTEEAIETAIKRSGVGSFANKKISALSRGMRQRVGIAQAIIHKPKVLLLDEPASGLDPEARHALSELLIELRDSGMTIIVSSHILAELEDYSTEMLVIQDGRVIEHRHLRSTGKEEAYLHLAIELAFSDNAHQQIIEAIYGVREVLVQENKIQLKLDNKIMSKQALLQKLIASSLPVEEFSEVKVNLQDEYIKTVANYKQNRV